MAYVPKIVRNFIRGSDPGFGSGTIFGRAGGSRDSGDNVEKGVIQRLRYR